jgi:hypothetical protein
MRTTLDIADDVLLAVKDLAQRQGSSAGAVISELARRGLHATPPPRNSRGKPSALQALGIRPLPRRGAVVSNEIVNRLRDDAGI